MSTATLDDVQVTSLEEFEFAKPCDGKVIHSNTDPGKPCPEEAKWAVWSRHHTAACPNTLNFCDKHKDAFLQAWEHLITCPAHHGCARCKVDLHGKQLSDMQRMIEL